ncbi:MAG: hypothetical protein FJ276_25635, partial [Planctomycetes bacterium]|nr:hypothetical protein [Planctomycetota bacterium]
MACTRTENWSFVTRIDGLMRLAQVVLIGSLGKREPIPMQFNHWAGRVEREQERRVRNRRERARQNRRRCDARRKRLRFELLEDRVLLASVYPAKLLFTGEPTAQTTGNAYVYTRAYPDDGLGLVSFACFGGIAANQEVGNLATVQCNGSGITVTTEPRPGSEFGEPIRLRFETVAVAGAVDHPGAPGGMANYSHTSSAPNSGGTLLQGSRSGASWLLPEQSAEMTVETTIGASFSIGFGVNGSVQTAPHTYQSVGLGFSMFYYVSIETFATLPVVSITDVQKPEGDDGPTQFVFSVSLSKSPAPELPVEVDYYVTNYNFGLPNGAAPDGLSGPPVDGRSVPDFHQTNGKLTFSAGGSLTQSITAEVIGDIAPEANEVFDVSLVAKNATLARRKAVGTILNDDDRTITVNSTEDPGDEIPDLSECTLHEAIFAANAFSGLDTIVFNIPGGGPFTIQPKKTFWVLNDPVVIDGTTQPGYSGTPVVEIDGSAAGPSGSDGLQIVGGGNTVRGLVLNRWRHSAISLSDGDDNLIERNYIGTDVTGRNGLGDASPDALGSGISTYRSSGNVIRGNLISGLDATAIALMGDRNTMQGNLVGTTADGLHAIGNGLIGVMIFGDDNTIGGTTTAEKNTISAAGIAGLYLRGNRNVVQGNFIGTGKDGTTELGNGGRDGPGAGLGIGVWGDSTANVIGSDGDGDADDAEGNVIAYTSGPGIGVGGPDGLTGQYPKDTLMRRNKIFANEGLGIDLALDVGAPGPNDNDELDRDDGPNHLQNTPILFLEDVTEDPPILRGELHSAPRESFIVDIYVTPVEHAQGDYQSAQGETWLGFVRVSTDDSGIATFEFPLPVPPVGEGENPPNPPYDPKKQDFTATGTDDHGNTSEIPLEIECDEDLSRYRKLGTACVFRRVHSGANGGSNEPNQQHDTVKIRVPKVAADIKAIVFKPDGTEDPDREVKRIDDGKYTRFEFQVFQKDNDPVGIWKVRVAGKEREIYLIFEQPSTSASLDKDGLLAYLYDDAETGKRDDLSYNVVHNSKVVFVDGVFLPFVGDYYCKRRNPGLSVCYGWPTRFYESNYNVNPFTRDVFTRVIEAVSDTTDANSAAKRLMETVSNLVVYPGDANGK